RKRPVSNPRHPQLQCANPCLEFLAPVPVPVPLTVLGPLIALGLQLLRDLGFEVLLDHGFDEPGQAVVALKQSSHHVLVYGNLELGHRISSSGCVGGYLNPFGGTVPYPVCSQATSLLHSLSDATLYGPETTDANGEDLFTGLEWGRRYGIVEAEAPEGYVI